MLHARPRGQAMRETITTMRQSGRPAAPLIQQALLWPPCVPTISPTTCALISEAECTGASSHNPQQQQASGKDFAGEASPDMQFILAQGECSRRSSEWAAGWLGQVPGPLSFFQGCLIQHRHLLQKW